MITDTQGDLQPRQRQENKRGYGHNGWLDAALTVTLVSTLPDHAPFEDNDQTVVAEVQEPDKKIDLSEAGRAGKQVFVEVAQPSCDACHTLSEAGSQGVVGPYLDAMKPDAAAVEAAVTGGVGVMPGYEGTLTPEQIKDLATYVVEATK